MNFFDLVTEIIGWIRIMLSPTLIGLILGIIVYVEIKNTIGIILGVALSATGVAVGIIWATRIFRSKKGTVHFISRIQSTPELDDDPDK